MKKHWKVGIVKDTSNPMLGLHGLHAAFRGLPGVDVVALVDSNIEDIQQKMIDTDAKRHYATCRDMFEREELDIVVLCSRHPYDHLPLIKDAAERGIHIYCEKPMTVSLEEADGIIGLVETNNIKMCVAHQARYRLGFITMKKMVEAGEIGTPMTIYGRGKNDHRGGGEDLVVLGTHILDLQAFFFGAPDCVFADITESGCPIAKTDRSKTVEPIGPAAGDSIFACFRFPGGVRGVFESRKDWFDLSYGIIHMGVAVIGTKGTLSKRFNDSVPEVPLRISRRPGPPEDDPRFQDVPLVEDRIIPGAAPLDYSLCGRPGIPRASHFMESNRFAAWDLMRAIEENRQPVSNVYNARLALEMIYGIYSSHLTGMAVNFPLADKTHPLTGCCSKQNPGC